MCMHSVAIGPAQGVILRLMHGGVKKCYVFPCNSGVDLGGPVPPSKIFYLYVTATIYSMKLSFNDVLSFINAKNYVYSYIIYRCW